MGLLDAISGGLTATTKAAAANEQGKLQGGQLLRAIMMQQAQQDHLRAQTEQERASTQFTQHRNLAPVLGEPGYAKAEGDVAGAKVDAETPGLVNREKLIAPVRTRQSLDTQTALAPGILREKQAESSLTEGREGRLLGKRIEAQNGSARMGLAEGKAFTAQNKQLVDAVPAYLQAKSHFAEARAGNPAALKSALLAYASVADPKAQLRQGVMNYVTQVDPSFAGTFEMALDRLTSGKLPPRIIDDMEKVIDGLHHQHAALYEQRRNAYVNRLPSTDAFIPTTDELFSVPNTSSGHPSADNAPAGAPHPIASKYGITPSAP